MFRTVLKAWRNALLLLLIASVVAGCAGQKQYRDGMASMDEGRVEDGLAQLEQASKADPGNMSYRASLTRSREQAVNRLLASANSERAAGHPEAAKADYERILKISPENSTARDGIAALEMENRHATQVEDAHNLFKKGEVDAALALVKSILVENPRNSQALLLQRQIEDQSDREQMATPLLKTRFKKPITLQFRDANVKMVFEALSRTSGINVLLDKDVKPDLKTSIFVKDVSVEDAIDLILMQSQLEKKIINDNTVFIYANTSAKLKEYQDLKIRSFHLTNAEPKEMLNMIKTLLKTKDIFIHEKTNSLVMRDTPEAIRLAEKMIADQDIAEPEVMLEVEVLEITRSRLTEIGIKYPSQIGFTALGKAVAAATPTLAELRQLNSASIVTSPALNVTLNALMQDSDTNLLASPRIRARNREKAKIMIGDRVPVITNAVTPVSTGSPVITGSVQYLDIGLKLEVEPEVHLDNDVSIKVGLEVSSIVKEVQNAQSGTLSYQVGTRNTSTVLRLKDGETQILAGLINDEDRNTANKVPGLGQLPILGHLFGSQRDDGRKTEIILSITPRIVGNNRIPSAREVEYWSGTESNLRSDPLTLRPLGTAVPNSSAIPSAVAPASFVPQPVVPSPAVAPTTAAPTSSAPTSSAPTPFSWLGPNKAKVGDRISVALNTQALQGANSVGFLVGFDPAVLKAADVVEGDFLKKGNSPSNFTKTIDQAGGQILIGLAGMPPDSAGGSVATLVFEVTSATPQSPVMVSRISGTGAGGEPLILVAPAPHFIAVSQ